MEGNHKIWATEKLFLDWFLKCLFFLRLNNIETEENHEFKVSLFLDTAPIDKTAVVNSDPRVPVISIPPPPHDSTPSSHASGSAKNCSGCTVFGI